MSIEHHDKVDGMGVDPIEGELVLLISDDLIWDENGEHFSLLERKIENYINFVKSGQAFEHSNVSLNTKVRIKLVYKHQPDERSDYILSSISSQLSNINILFSFGPLPAGFDH